jgi:hypothetical protein
MSLASPVAVAPDVGACTPSTHGAREGRRVRFFCGGGGGGGGGGGPGVEAPPQKKRGGGRSRFAGKSPVRGGEGSSLALIRLRLVTARRPGWHEAWARAGRPHDIGRAGRAPPAALSGCLLGLKLGVEKKKLGAVNIARRRHPRGRLVPACQPPPRNASGWLPGCASETFPRRASFCPGGRARSTPAMPVPPRRHFSPIHKAVGSLPGAAAVPPRRPMCNTK